MQFPRVLAVLLVVLGAGLVQDSCAQDGNPLVWMLKYADCGWSGLRAAAKMAKAYTDMLLADWKNCDKYFHCRGNYEAAQLGSCGRKVAQAISNARELSQNDPDGGKADQEANLYGRNGGDCVQKYIKDTKGKGKDVECSLPESRW